MKSRIRHFWTASIARQLMLGIAFVHAVLMTIFVFDLVSRERNFLMAQSTDQAIALAKTLAANGASWILANDIIGMEEVIRSQAGFPDLRYAMLLSPEGRVLAYTDRDQVGKYIQDEISRNLLSTPEPLQVLVNDDLLIDVAQSVEINNQRIGWARVGISRSGIDKNIVLVTRNGLLYTSMAILVGILFAWGMSRGLTSDIRKLVLQTQRVSEGNRKFEYETDRIDELGLLAKNVSDMVHTLFRREQDLKALEQKTAANEERLRFALEGAADGIWDWNLLENEIFISSVTKKMLGYSEQDAPDSKDFRETILHPADLDLANKAIEEHLATGGKTPYEIRLRMMNKQGQYQWVLSRGRALFDEKGTAYRFVGTHVDIDQLVRLEEKLAHEREVAEVTLHSIGDGVITTFADGRINFMNPVAEALTGWSNTEAQGKPLNEVFIILNDIDHRTIDNPVERCLKENQIIGMGRHTLLVNRDGKEISIEDSAAPIRDLKGNILGVVLVFHDATESRTMQRTIEHQAQHDALTGLWNRRAFDERLKELTFEAMEGFGQHVLLYIDLDQFKVVNDTVGHIAGDEMLRQISHLIESVSRESDMLARLGGDEFGLILIGCNLKHAEITADKIRQQISEFRFTWEDKLFQTGASIGLVEINKDLVDPNVLSLADLACYTAKDFGRNRIHIYSHSDEELSHKRSQMHSLSQIKQAIEHKEVILYKQFIQPLGAEHSPVQEVLVRLLDQDGELIPPGMFIPAAERFGLMPMIDKVVIDMACEWLLEASATKTCLNINLSGLSLSDMDLLGSIESRLDEAPQLAALICFEITETAAIGNLKDAMHFIKRLKRKGIKFALDDFGSGLSSFAYLKNLPVDYLKIDGDFVRDIVDDPVDALMVESMIKVSHQMGILAVAECVENEKTLKLLEQLGADYAQGFAIHKPSPL